MFGPNRGPSDTNTSCHVQWALLKPAKEHFRQDMYATYSALISRKEKQILIFSMAADSSVPLEYPDYRRLSRAGSGGRIFESRVKDAPKVFCPMIIRAKVELGKTRNGVGLSLSEISDVVETSFGITSDLVIDINSDSAEAFEVLMRDSSAVSKLKSGDSFSLPKSDVTVSIASLTDTVHDDNSDRRASISALLSTDVYADAVYVTLPQLWVIPDPEFRPRTSTLPLYPGSFWMQFFKTCWGLVSGATMVFGQDGPGNLGLVVLFKEVKAMRQCVLSLYGRYLIHPKEGLGMHQCKLRLVRYASVTAKKTISGSGPMAAYSQPGLPQSIPQSATSAAANFAASKEVPLSVAEAFQKLLERVDKLDRENQRLLSMLVDDNIDNVEEPKRERSPRNRQVPESGLPPWRQSNI